MKIFLTGATGFMGQAIVRALTSRGDVARVWTRDAARARAALGAGVECVTARRDADAPVESMAAAMVDAIAGCDAIINLAGEPVAGRRWSERQRARIRDSRVEITRAIVEAARRVDDRPRALVSTSASGYYGDAGAAPVDEDAASGDDFLASVCRDWEAAAAPARALGMRLAIIRVGIVLGRGGGALEQLVKPVRLGVGGPLGAGDQYMPWIHLDDVVRVFVEATGDARYEGVFNAAAPAPATNAELTRALGAVLRRPTLFRVPRFALKLAVGELAEVLLGGQRMIPRRLGELGFRFEHPALAGALEDLLGS